MPIDTKFLGNKSLLKKLNDFIRNEFSADLKKSLKYSDKGNDIRFNVIKKIYVMEK